MATLVTNYATHSCLVDLIDVTLAGEDANSKIVEVVTVAVQYTVQYENISMQSALQGCQSDRNQNLCWSFCQQSICPTSARLIS